MEAIAACSKAVSLMCKLIGRKKAVQMRNHFLTKELSKVKNYWKKEFKKK